jgi:uncharacterized membrane protein YdjX (TVP38/TMEM64 family)
MSNFVIEIMRENIEISYIISIFLNVVISILAVIPSFFLTAANIYVFGFWEGTLLSLIGEIIGSIVSFWLYRKGIRKFISQQDFNSLSLRRLLSARGSEAFLLILSLRLLPFVPSGLVNIGAAFGTVSLVTFGLATLIGKIPALLLEAYTVNYYISWEGEGKMILTILGIFLIGGYMVAGKMKRINVK